MAWPALLQELVVREPGESQQAQLLGQLAAEFRRDGTPTIKLVEALGPWLTGEDDAQRARATGVLSEVVEAVPTAAASEGEVGHLTQFFTARLTDWPAVRGALRGCLALVSRQPGAAPPPQPGDQQSSQQVQQQPAAQQLPAPDEAAAVELVHTCVSHVFIRALAAADRQLALRLLAAAMRGYGDALLGANLDLLEYTISSVDGEKDPRCLLLSFDAIQALLELYHRQPEEALCRERLEESAEELFEVLACYFPVTFTPPPNDPNKITRADLAAGLQRTLAAEPLFAPFVVPLIAEKLSSSLRQAKLDALSLLGACAASYGPAPLADHASALWAALRPELASPAAEGLLPADLAAAEELADAAAAALASCVAAFQRPGLAEEDATSSARPAGASLADAVLQDPLLSDMLACIQAPGLDAATHRRSALRAKVGARAAKALCTCGGSAGSHALAQLLPSLLEAAGQPAAAGSGGSGSSGNSNGSWQSQCLAWTAIVDLLEAVAAAANSGPDGSLVAAAVASAAAALAASAQQLAAAAGEEDEEESEQEGGSRKSSVRWVLHPSDCSQQQATMLQLALLATVLAAPHLAAGLPVQQVETAADSTLQQLIVAGSSPARQQQAVAPLRALASSSHAALVAERVLPQLVAAAGKPHSAAAALAALRALAEASGGLRLDIVLALDQAIQQQLPATLGPAGSDSSSGALLQQLLAAATAIVSAAPGDGPDEAGAAAGVLPLAQHLFDAAMLLPAQAAAAAAPDLVSACAELAFHAVRSAAAEQQQPLAAAAADALMEQQPVGLQAAVCCALLLPLRSGVAEAAVGAQLAVLVGLLVRQALGQQSSDAAAHWAALAAAALLNKWPQSDADGLGACAAAVMSQQLLPSCGLADTGSGSSAPAIQPGAWGCLAATTRGLAMRGHKEADAVLHAVVTYLDTAGQHWQQAAAEPGAAADGLATSVQQAARFLGAALDGSSGSVGLNKLSHAFAKPLWQQRCYTATSRQLLPLLERSEQQALGITAGGSSGSSTDGSPHPAQASPVLLLALGHLLQAAPAGVQQQEQQRMLPWLLQCLAGLREGPLADGDLLLALLLLLSDALMTPSGKQQVEGELLPRLVPALLGLIAFRPSPAVRETALQCLLLLLELPYTALHPYRRAVEKGLAAAVDDKWRAVRLAAARCRQAWSSA